MLWTQIKIWSEMKILGLIPKTSDAFHGFLPEELNEYLSNICFSPTEHPGSSFDLIKTAPLEGFMFKEVSINYVILVVSHFNFQTKGNGW